MSASEESSRRGKAGWIEAAITGIGMATIVTDTGGHILFINPVAEFMTGWPSGEAVGRFLPTVFQIENEKTRRPVANPVSEVLSTGSPVSLSDHTILIARDGKEWRIDDGAAPTHEAGNIVGAVLFFCDVGERQRAIQGVEDARAFAEGIIETVREPLVVLNADLQVLIANRSFYKTFSVAPQDTEGRSLLDLGNRQWDIPRLRELLEEILPRDSQFNDFEVDHEFEVIGRRSMILNARKLNPIGGRAGHILLAVEDATEEKRAVEALALSEVRYRRLFETAQDGILLVDPEIGRVFDANPFLTDLLGYSHDELVGKELWEIGLFQDIESNKAAFRTLQANGYIRYEDLPLLTKNGQHIEVEFVSNVYDVGSTRVIQCNIRDVTDRKKVEDAIRKAHALLELRVSERTAELGLTNGALKAEITRREFAESDRRELQLRLTTAQEDERQRIARELHDQMGQHLTALGLGLKLVKDAIPNPSPSRDAS